MGYKNFIRKAFNVIGLDIRKAKSDQKTVWLESFDIKTVIDVGANIGQFANDARKLYPDAAIYSFEPLPGPYSELLVNTRSFTKFNSYNLALGDRRAQIVKTYLLRNGVDASRVDVVSFGEERPFDTQSTEQGWTLNRRAHFLLREN